ncbi:MULTISPECIES: alpha/beta hydrolase [Nocardioides]|uniref:Alpha/beta hydrolase n=1 Tax=Nocardioides vastitatis TaxID=2568655 RepID=A0ABW0ZIZ1_9ACTN|nr:alpha/beta hydrolase [Nocardioides sp.]
MSAVTSVEPLGPWAASTRSRVVRTLARCAVRPLLTALPATGPARVALRAFIAGPAVLDLLPGGPASLVRPSRTPAGEWILPPGTPPRGGDVVLFLHGGGYVAGSARTYRAAMRLLAAETGFPVLALDYRLAPEHPIPAALDDALAAYEILLGDGRPRPVHVVADSAGAHLAIEMLAELATRGAPGPRRMVLFSPVLDPESPQADARDRSCPDPVVSPQFVRRCVSAARGGDPTGVTDALSRLDGVADDSLPAVLSLLGDTECYADDTWRLHRRLDRAGVENRWRAMPGQIHSFLVFARWLPEGRAAVVEAARFLRAGSP